MILEQILRDKKKEVARLKSRKPLAALKLESARMPKRKNRFLSALKKKRGIAVIAEIKRRSPSKGLLRRDFNAVKIARQYQKAGAAALSVLTDKKYFGGSADILKKVRRAVPLPILRKDFTVDEYQLYESRLLGADAVLFIARVLSRAQMRRFGALARKLGLEVLFEVHDGADLKKVAPLKPRLVGINNRDLDSFRVDLNVTKRLAKKVPGRCLIVSESGISGAHELAELKRSGVKAVLVGETLMKDKDPGRALKRLLGKTHGSR